MAADEPARPTAQRRRSAPSDLRYLLSHGVVPNCPVAQDTTCPGWRLANLRGHPLQDRAEQLAALSSRIAHPSMPSALLVLDSEMFDVPSRSMAVNLRAGSKPLTE